MTPRLDQWLASVTSGLDVNEEQPRTSDEIRGTWYAAGDGEGSQGDMATDSDDGAQEQAGQGSRIIRAAPSSVRTKVSMVIGKKRRATDDEADDDADMEPLVVPKNKRARMSDTVRRALTNRPAAIRRAFSRLSVAAAQGDTDDADASTGGVVRSSTTATATTRRAVTMTNDTIRRLNPFSQSERRVASATAAPQRMKICVVGDANAGKTAMIRRLTTGMFGETRPSTTGVCSTISVAASNGQVALIEIWDFPGGLSHRQLVRQQLTSSFFQAAVICYSIEDKDHTEAVTRTWKPFLEACLVSCPVFVAGLKKDKRPDHPTIRLSFVAAAERATAGAGEEVANSISAVQFGECSAVTGENVAEFWVVLVDRVLEDQEAGRRARAREQRRDRFRDVFSGVFRGFPRL
ncbi:P-loop containing nucleoside triphosphate hydrolase protein [Echria macrotheca]|uniref:P-loop containing nucleoside triphosphate hydrolase protein n=1 Tax=Echria macrotheca TaxID=438768 RepID=A0AAJ0FHL6_9PEZI|nr:P-loop containing nucleoside triphosphate hydrolase protein [Echria macrotheca]